MRGKYRALLIGVDTFNQDPERLLPLKGPEHDLDALSGALRNAHTGLFDAGNVRTLKNPSRSEAEAAIFDFFQQADREDVLLLYFSGHGRLTRENKFYLCMTDSVVERLPITAIAATTLRDTMEASPAQTFVVILDCCHSGAFRGDAVPNELAIGRGLFSLSSSRARQLADDGDGSGPSPFTGALVESLLDPKSDSDRDGRITFDDVYRVTYTKLSRLKQYPQRSMGEGTVTLARTSPNIDLEAATAGPPLQHNAATQPAADSSVPEHVRAARPIKRVTGIVAGAIAAVSIVAIGYHEGWFRASPSICVPPPAIYDQPSSDLESWCHGAPTHGESSCTLSLQDGGRIDGTCTDGKPHGQWKSIDPKGTVLWSASADHGSPTGTWIGHELYNGKLAQTTTRYVDGKISAKKLAFQSGAVMTLTPSTGTTSDIEVRCGSEFVQHRSPARGSSDHKVHVQTSDGWYEGTLSSSGAPLGVWLYKHVLEPTVSMDLEKLGSSDRAAFAEVVSDILLTSSAIEDCRQITLPKPRCSATSIWDSNKGCVPCDRGQHVENGTCVADKRVVQDHNQSDSHVSRNPKLDDASMVVIKQAKKGEVIMAPALKSPSISWTGQDSCNGLARVAGTWKCTSVTVQSHDPTGRSGGPLGEPLAHEPRYCDHSPVPDYKDAGEVVDFVRAECERTGDN